MISNQNKQIDLEYQNLVKEIHKVELSKALEMLQTFYEKYEATDRNNCLKIQIDYWTADILQKQGHHEQALALYSELLSKVNVKDVLYTTYLIHIGSILSLLNRKEEAFTLIEDYLSKEIGIWNHYLGLLRWYVENLDLNQLRKLEEFSSQINWICEELGVELGNNSSLKDKVIYLVNKNRTSNHELMKLNITCTEIPKDVGIQMLTDYIASEKSRFYRQQAINLKEYLLSN